MTVTSRIKNFLVQQFPSARKQAFGDDDPLLANGILDSLGILDLVAFLERDFKIVVADEDLVPEHFETLRRLTAFVEERQDGGAR